MDWQPQGLKQVAEGGLCFLRGWECLSRLALSPGLCPLAHLPAKSGQELTVPPRQENHLQPQAGDGGGRRRPAGGGRWPEGRQVLGLSEETAA